MPGRTPGRALACLLLVLCALGVAAPSARADVRVAVTSAAQDPGSTTTAVRARSLTRAVSVTSGPVGVVLGAAGRPGGAALGSDRQLGGVVLGAGSAAGASGSAGPVGVLPATHRSLAPLLLGQLPRPPSSSYALLLLSGPPSRAPPAVAGT